MPVLSKAFSQKKNLKVSNIQSRSIELSLLLSIPASFGLILASKEIVNVLFGYGSFTYEDVDMTASALKYFGFGIPAFALIKILSNFFFARNNTKMPFYISTFIVFLNVFISISFFNKVGFIIIPIATSISTWIGVICYIYILNSKNFLLIQKYLYSSIIKVVASTVLMSFLLMVLLNNYSIYLDYGNKFKAFYLLIIVGFVTSIYLISCYLTGVLKTKNFKIN